MQSTLTLPRPADAALQHIERVTLRATELLRAYPRHGAGLAVTALIAFGMLGAAGQPSASAAATAEAAPPPPPPLLIRSIAPEKALEVNAASPLQTGPNPAAAPFPFAGGSAARTQALECLALAVYYEAGSEDADGGRAVAQVVLNRVRHPAFPASVCGVVFQGSTRPTGCQFTFTCDGSLARRPDAAGWNRAYRIAQAALSGAVFAPVGLATHYHANYVVPYWASSLAKNAVVGAHIFYRWAGGWGRSAAFNERYAGSEPAAAMLRTAALAAERQNDAIDAEPEKAVEVLAQLPGAESLKLTPAMRRDKLVAIRFNMAARKASDDASHEAYESRYKASDNLRWSLSDDSVAAGEKPLGPVKPMTYGGSAETTSAAAAGAAAALPVSR